MAERNQSQNRLIKTVHVEGEHELVHIGQISQELGVRLLFRYIPAYVAEDLSEYRELPCNALRDAKGQMDQARDQLISYSSNSMLHRIGKNIITAATSYLKSDSPRQIYRIIGHFPLFYSTSISPAPSTYAVTLVTAVAVSYLRPYLFQKKMDH